VVELYLKALSVASKKDYNLIRQLVLYERDVLCIASKLIFHRKKTTLRTTELTGVTRITPIYWGHSLSSAFAKSWRRSDARAPKWGVGWDSVPP